ncbi:16S rRNA (guanine(527)-N(7))-methyltransferase RsmG [Planctomycetota bacterium]
MVLDAENAHKEKTPEFEYASLTAQQCQQLTRFSQLIQDGNRQCNLTRIVDREEIYLRHFSDALESLPTLDRIGVKGRLLDVGSGAGIPGLVLAIARPKWRFVSLEATGKKARFQSHAISSLSLTHATVNTERAETLARDQAFREQFDVVTARALASLPTLLELCVPFLKVGGFLVAYKGIAWQQELDQAQTALTTLSSCVDAVEPYSLAVLAEKAHLVSPQEAGSFSLVIIRKNDTTPSQYPRIYSRIRHQPL